MRAGGEGGSFIGVGRLRAVYLVPSDHPAPAALKDRLDEALSKGVPAALAAGASRLFGDADQSVWLVRRLDLGLAVNADWGRDTVAAAWAAEIARALSRELRGDGDARNCIRFPTRSAYLASFLQDLADSCAWGKWYYRGFEGLRLLPQSAALRTAVCADAGEGLSALLQLDRHARARLVGELSRQDARRVLDALAGTGERLGGGASLDALWSAWGEAELGASAGEGEAHAALRLFLCVCGRGGAGHASADVARALVRLAHLLGEEGGRARGLLETLTDDGLSKLFEARGTADAEALAPLRLCPVPRVREVFEALFSRGVRAPRAEEAGDEGPRHTPFGGLLMLLPALDELALEEAAEGWPGCGGVSAAALLRLLLLAHCCGGARSLRFFADPLWRELLAAGPTLTPRHVAAWQKEVGRARAERFGDVMEARLRSLGLVRGRRLALVRAGVKGGKVCVLLDAERGVWLRAYPFDARRPAACVERMRRSLSWPAGEPPVVLCDESLAGALGSLGADVRALPFGGAEAERLALEDPAVAEACARRKRVGADLLYLTLPAAFGLRGGLRLALAVAAEGLMRSFSARLPGFALSGLEYLYTHFLDCAASVEAEAARRVARLGRPPLNVVLNMTGAARGAHRLGWLDGRPLNLFQEG